MDQRPAPSLDRAAFALLCSTLTVSLLLGAYVAISGSSPAIGLLTTGFAFLVAGPCALIFALPAYLLFRKRFPDRWWSAAICGGLFASLPYPLYWLVVGLAYKLERDDLLRLIPLAGELFVLGSAAGLVFHMIVTMPIRKKS
jgi:hypothetical protein